jgi:multidrug efflux pump subunit AcrB
MRAQQHPQLVSADQAKVFGIQKALYHPRAQLEPDLLQQFDFVRVQVEQDLLQQFGLVRVQVLLQQFGLVRVQVEPDLLQQFGLVRVQLKPDLYVCAAHHFRIRMDENVKEVVAALLVLH